jgi:apyrase
VISAQAGFINPEAAVAKVKPSDFEEAAKRACKLNVNDAQSSYPGVQKDNIPYICMDLVYQYTLLVDGFGKRLSFKVKYELHTCRVSFLLFCSVRC